MRWEFGPEDEAALTTMIDDLVDRFEQAVGYDGWVAHHLLYLRWSHMDGQLRHWTPDDLAELLLGVFPRKVVVDDADVDQVVPTAKAFLRWLDDIHGLTGDPIPRLLHALDMMAADVARGLRDTSRFGPAKALASMMGQAGIDMEDPAAVGAFMQTFNDLPMEERRALLPMPGDPFTSPLDGMLPLPPVRPLPPEEMARTAEAADLYGWIAGFVEAIGQGLALTKKGNLKLADGKAIADRLGLDDIARAEQLGIGIRSTADLADLDLTFRVARAAGFVKVRHSRVSPTKRAGHLVDAPARAWPRVVEGLLDVGILDHRYQGQQYLVPPWVERLDDSVDALLLALYVAGAPVEIDELVDTTRADLAQVWQLDPPGEGADPGGASFWWDVPDRNVREILRRLAQAGVLEVADVEIVPREHVGHDDRGGTAALTPAGRVIAAQLARRAGVEVAEVGRLRDASVPDLLTALAEVHWQEGDAELDLWATDRGLSTALYELVDAVDGGLPVTLVPAATSALITCANALPVDEAAPILRRLLDHRLLGPVVGGWLVDHGQDDVPRGGPVDGLVSMAAVGAADDAVLQLQQMGPSTTQRSLLETARSEAGADAIPLLQAVADLHDDKTVAKAARKALFRLGVRR